MHELIFINEKKLFGLCHGVIYLLLINSKFLCWNHWYNLSTSCDTCDENADMW